MRRARIPRSGSRAPASCGSTAKTRTGSTSCRKRKATSPARPPSFRCACRSATPPRWWRSSARASWRRRWCSWLAAIPPSACRSRPRTGRTSTSRCWRCAAACARCRGTRSSAGAGRSRSTGGTNSANTRRQDRSSTCRSRPTNTASPRSPSAAPPHQLKVNVSSDKPAYPIRSTAKVTVQVTLPDGKPAAGAEIALAAVDEALLELEPNTSWDLLAAMLQRRGYGVETATAQMQVVGKRHYGRKALPAGGGGGKAPTRELFDTLLLWKPALVLDANGRAQVEVPLNDALTSFRIVAVADSGLGLFGTGSASIRSTQDLQLISGLPPLVREGDRFSAMLTLRNTTQRAMQVEAHAKVSGVADDLPPRKLEIAAGQSAELVWPVTVPADRRTTGVGSQRAGAGRPESARCDQGDAEGGAGGAGHGAAGHAVPARSPGRAAAGAAGRQPARARRRGDCAGAQTVGQQRRPAPLLRTLSVFLPGTEGIARDGAEGRRAVAAHHGGAADLSRRRRPGVLLPAARRRCRPRQRYADQLSAGGDARSQLRDPAAQPRADAGWPGGVRRRPDRRASTGRRKRISMCASWRHWKRCRATAGRGPRCWARSRSRPTCGRLRRCSTGSRCCSGCRRLPSATSACRKPSRSCARA